MAWFALECVLAASFGAGSGDIICPRPLLAVGVGISQSGST